MYKDTTLLAIRLEKTIKDKAVKRSSDLGISLTTVIKALLGEFIAGKAITLGAKDDDQHMAFYENNPNMIHFEPAISLDTF